MFIESSPIGYELSKDRLRKIAHRVEMARPYKGEPTAGDLVTTPYSVRALANGILAHPWLHWIHVRVAGHAHG